MTLSEDETQWANALKLRVEASEDIQNLSDYEYAQFAIHSQGKLRGALSRIQGLQAFREEYNINDTVEEGIELLRAFQEQQSWFLLDVNYDDYGLSGRNGRAIC